MEWVDILTPSIAVAALLIAVGLGVQAWRQGRTIRRLEDRLAQIGSASVEAPLQRLAELQQRMSTSQGGHRRLHVSRGAVVGVAAVVLVAVVAGGAWTLLRGDGGGATAASPGTTDRSTTTASAPPPDPGLCKTVRTLDNPGSVFVTVFNASGVTGAAQNRIAPDLTTKGYSLGLVDNPPDNRNDLRRSQVQYVRAADRNAACNVAKDLGLTRVAAVEGYTPDQIGGADINVVVVVGRDLANG